MQRTTKQNHVPQPRAEWEARGDITHSNNHSAMQSLTEMAGNKEAELTNTFHTTHLGWQPKKIHSRAHEKHGHESWGWQQTSWWVLNNVQQDPHSLVLVSATETDQPQTLTCVTYSWVLTLGLRFPFSPRQNNLAGADMYQLKACDDFFCMRCS